MSLKAELQPVLDWYKLVWRVCVGIMPFAVAIAIYHGPMNAWQFGWGVFNLWIGWLNFTRGHIEISTGKGDRWSWTSFVMGCISLIVAGMNFVLLFS